MGRPGLSTPRGMASRRQHPEDPVAYRRTHCVNGKSACPHIPSASLCVTKGVE